MIRIPSVALGLALLAGSATAAAAQGTTDATPPAGRQHGGWGKGGAHGGHKGQGMMMGGRLFDGIDLSADQKTRIRQIGERYRTEMRSIAGLPAQGARPDSTQRADVRGVRRERPKLTPEQRQRMDALRDRQLAEVRGVLTAAQQQKFDANLAEMKAHRAEHEKNRGARKTQRQG